MYILCKQKCPIRFVTKAVCFSGKRWRHIVDGCESHHALGARGRDSAKWFMQNKFTTGRWVHAWRMTFRTCSKSSRSTAWILETTGFLKPAYLRIFVAFGLFAVKFKKESVSVLRHLKYLAVSQVNEEKILQTSNNYATLKWPYFYRLSDMKKLVSSRVPFHDL